MKNGVFSRIKCWWMAKNTEQKISTVIDFICDLGGGFAGAALGRRLSEDQGIVGSVCTKTVTFGLGIAGANVARHTLNEAYAKPAAKLIDGIRDIREERKKEAEG